VQNRRPAHKGKYTQGTKKEPPTNQTTLRRRLRRNTQSGTNKGDFRKLSTQPGRKRPLNERRTAKKKGRSIKSVKQEANNSPNLGANKNKRHKKVKTPDNAKTKRKRRNRRRKGELKSKKIKVAEWELKKN